MPALHLSLFGGFRLRRASGSPIALPAREAQALLAYLAVPAGRGHPRDKLASLGRLALAAGRPAEGREHLARARDLLVAMNARRWLAEADALLSEAP